MLNKLTIKEAHLGLKRKDFSCLELTKSCLSATKEKNSELNAFITISEETAIADAKKIDQKIAFGTEISPLTGIPFSVKDSIVVAGVRSTGSSHILDNYYPPYTATVIQRILDQGGIMIGKTNCDAFGHGASNENSMYGVVKNPLDQTKVAGGSSGGSGAAVAADMGIYSIGEDTGGSVRCPSACCGVVGLKVSYGRNSRYGAMPMSSSLDTVGPIAKSVYDISWIEEVIAGIDPLDSTTRNDFVPQYSQNLDLPLKGLKAGIPKEYFTEGISPLVEKRVRQAIEKIASLGVEIKEVSLPMTKYAIADYYIIVPAEDSANLARLDGIRYGTRKGKESLLEIYNQSRKEGFPDEVKRRIFIGTYVLSSGYYDAYYTKAQKVRTLIIQDFLKVFDEVDFLLTPTQPTVAFGLGEHLNNPLTMYLQDVFVSPASVAGLPALAIPCGLAEDNLPASLQIIGPSFREDLVLRVGYQYEINSNTEIRND